MLPQSRIAGVVFRPLPRIPLLKPTLRNSSKSQLRLPLTRVLSIPQVNLLPIAYTRGYASGRGPVHPPGGTHRMNLGGGGGK
jgi:hypothetical protein